MSYITSSLSPYRSDNVWKEFAGILKEDYEWVCSSLKDRELIFPIAFVILMNYGYAIRFGRLFARGSFHWEKVLCSI